MKDFTLPIWISNYLNRNDNCEYPHSYNATDAAMLKKLVEKDHVFINFKNNYRNKTNFQYTDSLVSDCDNDHSNKEEDWITPEKIKAAFPDVSFVVYTSRHHMKWKGNKSPRPRYHVIFFIERITDPDDQHYKKTIGVGKYKGHPNILNLTSSKLKGDFGSQKTDIGAAVEFLTSVIKRRSTAFLLSDFITDKDFSKALTIANRKHDVVAVQVYDKRVAELPDVGLIKVRDAETGHEALIDTSSMRTRSRHAAWWNRQQAQMQEVFSHSGVDHVSVRTDHDYVAALMRLFRYRA